MTRRGRVGWWATVAALGIGLATGGRAYAQREVNIPRVVFSDAQIFHPATDPSRFVSVYDTRNLEPGQYTLGLYGTFAENPVDLSFDSSGDRSSHLVRYSIGADLIATVGITERFQLGLDIPGVYNSTEPVVNLASNTEPGTVVLLPEDSDASAARLRERLRELTGAEVGVIVSDSFGRAWRQGTTDVAIGVAGIRPLLDLQGTRDRAGYELHATVIAVADELAGAAQLVMGKTDGVPAAVISGVDAAGEGSARELVIPAERDLFR